MPASQERRSCQVSATTKSCKIGIRSATTSRATLNGVSWQYVLLLPFCRFSRLRRPRVASGHLARARASRAIRLRCWRARSSASTGRLVRRPFDRRNSNSLLLSLPSRLSSPLASLCLLVVANVRSREREAVMRRYEVNRRAHMPAAVIEEVARTGQAGRELRHHW